jgi:hypothetical protein
MNPLPPAILDGQKVILSAVSINPQKWSLGDSWPTGTLGNCFAVQMLTPINTDTPLGPPNESQNNVYPNQAGVLATNGGTENGWAHAIVTDFDAPIQWLNGAYCNGPIPDRAYVLYRNADQKPKGPVFPPAHPPKQNTQTSIKVYHAT